MLTAHLSIPYKGHEIVMTAESPDMPRSSVRSAGNSCVQEEECVLGDDKYRPSSRHQMVVKHGDAVLASRVLLASGGATGVHSRSAIVIGDTCFAAVGPFVCALKLPTLELLWHALADAATCFGIYDAPGYESIISHGELEIARLNYLGQVLWSAGGRDIFTEGFELHEHYAEAIDFDGTKYRFELETGQASIITT